MNSEEEFASRRYPIVENMPSQRSMWRFERIGWWVLVLLVLLTLAGLFSDGPLSGVRASTASGDLRLEYQRFERYGAVTGLVARIRAGEGGRAVLFLGGDFLRSFTVESIQPEPAISRGRGSGIAFEFENDGQGWLEVQLSLRPKTVGPSRSSAASPPGETLQFSQFIYP